MRPCATAALLVLIAALAGCTDGEARRAAPPLPGDPTRTPSSVAVTEPPSTTTTVALPAAIPVDWHPCDRPFQCATIEVPVDYQDPGGATLDLAVVRHPANHPDQRIGSLLVNPGGPGASGVGRVLRGFEVSPEVADRFDVVGFDPRGVGDSQPIQCGAAVPAFRATDFAPDTDAERTALEAAARAVAEECTATEGTRLPHLGTQEVAHDVEVIRRALGEDRISFVGLSYGTLIGQLWAEAYPTSVRAMVLDGVVDPGTGGATASIEQAEGLESSLRAMHAACRADPSCPLARWGGLIPGYDELGRRIEAAGADDSGVGPNQLAYAAFYATYDADTWPRLWDAIAAGLGGNRSGIAELAASFERLVPYTTFALVSCLDGPHPNGFAAWEAEAAGLAESSPRFGQVLANELLPCAFWPATGYQPHAVVAGGTPAVLVIGSTGDAATPYEAAVEVARTLDHGVLLTVDLAGHVALGDSDCASQIATRYLVDGAVPPPATRC